MVLPIGVVGLSRALVTEQMLCFV